MNRYNELVGGLEQPFGPVPASGVRLRRLIAGCVASPRLPLPWNLSQWISRLLIRVKLCRWLLKLPSLIRVMKPTCLSCHTQVHCASFKVCWTMVFGDTPFAMQSLFVSFLCPFCEAVTRPGFCHTPNQPGVTFSRW